MPSVDSTQMRWWPVSAMYMLPLAATASPQGLNRAVLPPGWCIASGDGGSVPWTTSIAFRSVRRSDAIFPVRFKRVLGRVPGCDNLLKETHNLREGAEDHPFTHSERFKGLSSFVG